MKRIFCTVCTLLVAWQAWASEIDDNLDKFEDAAQKWEQQAKSGGRIPVWIKQFRSVRVNVLAGDLDEALGVLRGYRAAAKEFPDLDEEQGKKAVLDLIASLEKREHVKTAPIDAAISHAIAAVKKAQTTADLDATLDELAKIQIHSRPIEMSQAVWTEYNSKAKGVYDFVLQYQEYLAAKAGGYDEKARAIAGKLADSPSRLLPRSELLAKAYEPKGSSGGK